MTLPKMLALGGGPLLALALAAGLPAPGRAGAPAPIEGPTADIFVAASTTQGAMTVKVYQVGDAECARAGRGNGFIGQQGAIFGAMKAPLLIAAGGPVFLEAVANFSTSNGYLTQYRSCAAVGVFVPEEGRHYEASLDFPDSETCHVEVRDRSNGKMVPTFRELPTAKRCTH